MNTSPFDFEEYREYLKVRLREMPSRGHGQLAKISKMLRVHPTLLTQILGGGKKLSSEHGLLICEYLGMSELETEFFLCLIERERAGHHKLKKRWEEKLHRLREEFLKPQARMEKHEVLSESDRALFYSNWFYSAVRLFTSIEGPQSIDKISVALKLERKLVQEVLDFLLRTGLIAQEGDRLKMGPQRTYLPPESPLVSRHHSNWRLKAIENFQQMSGDELAFTAPISLARKDFFQAKKILLGAIEQISKLVDTSEAETVGCVNVDLFFVQRE